MAALIKKAISERKPLVVGNEDAFYRDYTILNKIGEGAFATVHLCTNNTTNEEFAVKLVDKSRAGIGELKDIWHEVNIMRDLNHKGIIYLYGNYEGDENIIIVMNRVNGGTLFNRIIAMRHYTEEMAAEAVRNLLSGLDYLHTAGIAHRDIKPENLLLKNKMSDTTDNMKAMTEVVIADFGLACRPPMKTTCGSPCYLAPEVITATFGQQFNKKSGHYDTKCDIWSLGVVLYVMLSGKFPFAGTSRTSLFQQILNNGIRFPSPSVWDAVSSDAKHFISSLLTKDPTHRPSAAEALKHRWITGEGLLQPLQRGTDLTESVKELKAFTMKKHVSAALSVYRVAGALFNNQQNDTTLAFRKYIKADLTDPFSERIMLQSQSNKEVMYTVDLGVFGRRMIGSNSATGGKAHRMMDVCNCPSNKICRHIQYVYQWLFVGDRAEEVVPHVSDCEERRLELLEKMKDGQEGLCKGVVPAALAAATLGGCAAARNAIGCAAAGILFGIGGHLFSQSATEVGAAFQKLQNADEFILCCWKFKHAFDLTPESERKSVLSGDMVLPGALAFTKAGLDRKQRVGLG
eukprot:TRINITY_DN488_c5_g1_i1.p1 TRINITY_DN488_c5_g1~~TRINITY_DN488_c5_g1_i1.p1  ORF type:complete len:574 (+),score=118.90 TRINITY_DN488_c5_g1_i1:25-1746(+)